MTDIYGQLGVKRRINAAGTLTRLGGSLMAPDVLDAMRAAAQASVDIGELQSAASRVIAQVTGAEAGLVTSGASAAVANSFCGLYDHKPSQSRLLEKSNDANGTVGDAPMYVSQPSNVATPKRSRSR